MHDTLQSLEVPRDFLVFGLRSTRALEHQALALMDRQLDHLASYPDIEQRLRAHRQETEIQIARIDEILDGLDETASAVTDAALSMVGNLAPLAYIFAPDNILRNSFANFAFENYEVASYRSLIATAEIGNFGYAIPLLQQTLDEEVAMAGFCHENLPALTQRYLRLRAAGKTASR